MGMSYKIEFREGNGRTVPYIYIPGVSLYISALRIPAATRKEVSGELEETAYTPK